MVNVRFILVLVITAIPHALVAEDLGEMWGTAQEEEKYYPIVNIPIPPEVPMRPGSFEILPDGRLAVGTRRGDIYFIKGAFQSPPEPRYHLFASGQDEIFGLAWKDGAMTTTQFGEVTRIADVDGDGIADRYDTLSNNWGYAEGHEFAFGSKHDPEGNIWVALGLSGSYHSRNLFRGWAVKVTPDGRMIPVCSGLRSPGGVGPNAQGVMFCIESQGPWNGCCSLKHLKQGAFLGHPASYNWYPFVPGMDAPAVEPDSPSRLQVEKKRVKELVPPVVRFPYIRMGRSIAGFRLNQTGGKFGPFENQIFLGDYTLSIILRVTTEQVNGVWQGACYPFREGLSTGIMHVEFSPKGQLIVGGFTTNRQWPVRGTEPFAIQRIDWSGVVPFEIREINIRKDGFLVTFTKPVDRDIASGTEAYIVTTYTHNYAAGYGSPEVDHTTPKVIRAVPSADGLSVMVHLDKTTEGHIHDFDLAGMVSRDGEHLLHTKAYYTVNEIPDH
ncbi:MAG: hypothetical protein CMN05_05100 [Roseibacillus sp.]|jgi:hypothetical protein|nr:hypothetical protein [Roseibacillus sp.]MCP4732205.1 hypothetical protein [Roseibacillus sp.]MDP6208018.1 hypothetical protein [Roseibacillus sp.]MDP7307640.1 hypothetical protein [Roseibacillus sp.]MDP7654442.1 hypothetical protein [Roseibacillus sp.]|tara:strand:+ start:22151 stop:23641 length:1491 start_codon:yes stop_codon:yes gene_type:complete